jgi:dihydrofolate reductase
MRLSAIAALDLDRAIGKGGQIPWRLPADLKRFKQLTLGKPVVMGRKTFASIGKPLVGRENIAVTRDPGFSAAGVFRAGSLDEALDLAAKSGAEEAFVIGGAALYEEALPRCHTLYLTLVEGRFFGDVFFPDVSLAGFGALERERFLPDEKNPFAYTFLTLARGEGAPLEAERLSGLLGAPR